MKYRIYGYFGKGDEKTRYFLQTNQLLPGRTMLTSNFLWVSILSDPTEFEDIAVAIKWLTMLVKLNEHYSSLSIERVG